MGTTNLHAAPLVMTLAIGCALFDDDQGPVPVDQEMETDGGQDEPTCDFDIDDFLDSCSFPMLPRLTITQQGDSIFWTDDPANATTIGPGGWVLGTVTTADWVGYVVEGDRQCGVSCVVPAGSSCFSEGNSFCRADSDGPEGRSCLFCGPEEGVDSLSCAVFNRSCLGESSDDATDTGASPQPTGTGGGASGWTGSAGGIGGTGDWGGTGDTTGANAPVESVPVPALFERQPNVTFGTTQYVLDRFGGRLPPNVVAESLCDIWDEPVRGAAARADELYGKLPRSKFQLLKQRGEQILRDCDNLRLSVQPSGVRIESTARQSLATRLGLREGDTIIEFNGVKASNLFQLKDAVLAAIERPLGNQELRFVREGEPQRRLIRLTDG